MHVGALFCLIVAKLSMLKVCIQSVHHGGIKFAIGSDIVTKVVLHQN